jgi:tetratricopeptide (TPR) repeat protein
MRARAPTLLLCAALALPAYARAPSQRAGEEAYRKGLSSYDLGDYPQAIESFKRAYELTRAPLLLFNIAQAQRLHRDWAHALEMYRSYLRVLPDAPNRADVRAFLIEMRVRLDAEAREASRRARLASLGPVIAPPRPAEPKPEEAPPRAVDEARRDPLVHAAEAPRRDDVARATSSGRGRAELIAGLGVAALGVAALAAGGVVAARSAADADRLASLRGHHGAWDAAAQATWNDGRASSVAATSLFVVGGALAAGGSVLAIVGGRARSRHHTVALAPLTGGGVVVWSCGF